MGGNNQGGNGQGGNVRKDNGRITVRVNPQSVHQGGTLTITVQGCKRGGTVASNAFSQVQLSNNGQNQSTASARIHDHTTPGQYNLAVRCNDNSNVATVQFTVLSARGAQGGLGGSVGPSSTEMAIGGALVATAAVGGGLFVARRRRTVSGRG
ncbi:hypothetical protein OG883_13240 [Streptomyces sp. NBC_01142]|uniref:hypothetical protein n=1 Tax=Streptomyces sp. NBC_01142 TaxID=2975865 RepID=UPI002254B150|nr:hypothetical protein [Streptomyces sp. NBC_01142]MCX4820854.1 hypothetical protein [Streptomyces sp. NBC_01142]